MSPNGLAALGYAIAIGLLVGLERGWTERDADDGHRVAGLRTFGLLGLIGGVAALTAGWIGAVLILTAGAALLVGYARQARKADGRSATGTVAAVLVLGLGHLAASGRPGIALAAAAVTMFILSRRRWFHSLLDRLSATDVRAAAEFAILALVLYPLAPDRQLGPLDAINPHRLLLLIVCVSGASFLAWLAGRHLARPNAPLIAAAAGALASSTAVTAALARRLRDRGFDQGLLTKGIMIASMVAVSRVALLVAALTPQALPQAVAPLALSFTVLSVGLWRTRAAPSAAARFDPPAGNPLDLRTALMFAALTALTTLGARFAATLSPSTGSIAVLTATGVADVDAAMLAFSVLPANQQSALGPMVALPVAANMAFKATLVVTLSGGKRGGLSAGTLAACAVSMALVALLMWPA
jgi:uncharacterized membrane protein (DUF4010 family)